MARGEGLRLRIQVVWVPDAQPETHRPPFPSINWKPRAGMGINAQTDRRHSARGRKRPLLSCGPPALSSSVWGHGLALLGSPSPGASRTLGQFKHFPSPPSPSKSQSQGRDTQINQSHRQMATVTVALSNRAVLPHGLTARRPETPPLSQQAPLLPRASACWHYLPESPRARLSLPTGPPGRKAPEEEPWEPKLAGEVSGPGFGKYQRPLRTPFGLGSPAGDGGAGVLCPSLRVTGVESGDLHTPLLCPLPTGGTC